MDQDAKRELLEFAMQAVGQAVNGNQNRIFNCGTIRPDRFPSSSFADWVQWKTHFVAVAEANGWTNAEAIGALPVCLSGHALEEFQAAPRELKTQVVNRPAPTVRALFEHLDRAMGVTRNDRAGRNEFKSLVQKESESLREFARRVRSLGMLVFGHLEADQRDELFRDRFLDGLLDSDLLEVLLRERTRGFVDTVDRALELESIANSARTRQSRRVAYARLAQEPAVAAENQIAVEMKQQLNEMTSALNSLTNMVGQFVSAVVSARRCDVCGDDGHSAEACRFIRNPLNL